MRKLFYAALFFATFSCDKPADEATTQQVDSTAIPTPNDVVATVSSGSTKKLVPLAPANPKFDKIASFISAQVDTGFGALRDNEDFLEYASTMDSTWEMVITKRLNPMRAWAKQEYDSIAHQSDTLFYPFSGPDFLNAHTLFPHTKTYFLIALEPIGLLPDYSVSDTKKWSSYFKSMQLSLQDIYKKSYFITKRMNVHLGGEHVYGTLPLIAVFLKQTGHVISDIKSVRLDSAGSLIESHYDSLATPRKRPRGVKVEFFQKGDTTLRQLYYFSADLGDAALGEKFRFRKFLDRMGGFNAYAKSASYLMHYDEFSVPRNQILRKAKLLLQDDTGIAFRFIDTTKWNVHLYGKYVAPVKDFSKYLYQKDLLARYTKDSSHVKALSFELGYHWGSKKNNLMLFVRK